MTEKEERQLQMIREKMAQLRAREQAVISRSKERKRKERTRRLIQYGVLVEKCLGANLELSEVERILGEVRTKMEKALLF